MFAVIELLGEDEDLCGTIARHDDNAVLVGDNDVVRRDLDPVAVDRDIHTAEAVMADCDQRRKLRRVKRPRSPILDM